MLAHAGDVAGAQRVWAEGVALLPDLPNVYLARGRWEMDNGDLKAAAADLSTASAKAPHYADPLKAWGDVHLYGRGAEPHAATLVLRPTAANRARIFRYTVPLQAARDL